MDVSFLLIQLLNGLASASALFITACGLTLIFGVTRITNFAHGSFYMLGAYVGVTLLPVFLGVDASFAMFVLCVLASAVIVGALGAVMEVVLLRRIYRMPELFQLLATFGVVLVVQDLVVKIWGPLDLMGPRVPGLKGAVEIFGERFPAYELFIIAMGPLVLGALVLLMRRTRFGLLVRAATQDREMTAALGVNQAVLFTATLFLGSTLAGLGGALQVPRMPANSHMDISIIADAFVVTVVGGLGSVPGAFLAALMIGLLQAFGILLFPKITIVLVFALMALVLTARPTGLMGREEAHDGAAHGLPHLAPWGRRHWQGLLALGCALALLPLLGDDYVLKLAGEVLVFALFALSLNLLVGLGGTVSFGHAAYFGLGAYCAALGARGLGMEAGLLLAMLGGGVGAAVFGVFVVRLKGIYLAMMTLAAAQIAYAVAFQWVDVTGGDNGLIGVWPASYAAGRAAYYYLVLALGGAGIAALLWLTFSPFGYGLRAGRDAARRAEAIGIDVQQLRWLAFTLAGVGAGLAGGLFAFSKGTVDPTLMAIPMSVDGLAMGLLGGIHTVFGPVAGAAMLHLIKDFVMPLTDMWRMVMGLILIALVLVFPRGLVGSIRAWRERA